MQEYNVLVLRGGAPVAGRQPFLVVAVNALPILASVRTTVLLVDGLAGAGELGEDALLIGRVVAEVPPAIQSTVFVQSTHFGP